MASHKIQNLRFAELSTVSVPSKPTKSRPVSPITCRTNVLFNIYTNCGVINLQSHNNLRKLKSETDLAHLKILSQAAIERIKTGDPIQFEPDFKKKLLALGINSSRIENSMEDHLSKIKTKCIILKRQLNEEIERAENAEQKLLKLENDKIHNKAFIELLKGKLYDTTRILKKENECKEELQLKVNQIKKEIETLNKGDSKRLVSCDKCLQFNNDGIENFQKKIREIEITKYDEHIQTLTTSFREINHELYQRMRCEEQNAAIIAEEANITSLIAKRNKLETSLQCALQEKQELELASAAHTRIESSHSELIQNVENSTHTIEHETLKLRISNALQNHSEFISLIQKQIIYVDENIVRCKDKLEHLEHTFHNPGETLKNMLEKNMLTSRSTDLFENLTTRMEKELTLSSEKLLKTKNPIEEIEINDQMIVLKKKEDFSSENNFENIHHDVALFNITSFPNEELGTETITGKMLLDWISANEKETELDVSSHILLSNQNDMSLGKGDMIGEHEKIHKNILLPKMDLFPTSNFNIQSELNNELSNESHSLQITKFAVPEKKLFD